MGWERRSQSCYGLLVHQETAHHRDYFEPYSVYFTLVSDGDKKYIVSDGIPYVPDNHEKLMNAVNMVLATFGECTVDFLDKRTNRNELL